MIWSLAPRAFTRHAALAPQRLGCALLAAALMLAALPAATAAGQVEAAMPLPPLVPLPPPQQIRVHPDGAWLSFALALPAGRHERELPSLLAEALNADDRIEVAGAGFEIVTRVDAPQVALPDGLAGLLAERNRLADVALDLATRSSLAEQAERHLRQRLPSVTHDADPTAWTAAITAAIARQEVLDRDRAALSASRAALTARAEQIVRAAGLPVHVASCLALDRDAMLDRSALHAAFLGVLPETRRRILVLDVFSAPVAAASGAAASAAASTAAPGTANVRLRIGFSALRWTPAAIVVLPAAAETPHAGLAASASAGLVRRVVLSKPPEFTSSDVPIEIVTAPRRGTLEGPRPSAVGLHLGDVPRDWRTQVSSVQKPAVISELSDSTTSLSLGTTRSAIHVPMPPTPTPEIAIAQARTVAEPGSDLDGVPPQREALGVVDLPRGSSQVVIDLPTESLRIEADRFELAPTRAPVAQRRVSVRLGQRGLLPGPLSIVVAGRMTVSGPFRGGTAGTRLDLCAEQDSSIFAAAPEAWTVEPRDQTPTRRREGARWSIHAFTPIHGDARAPRHVRLLLPAPVSRLEEISVALDPACTPGALHLGDGLHAYDLALIPGAPQTISFGWLLTAKGGFTF